MKRLQIENGVVMAHPFELAELLQNFASDNMSELLATLFEAWGVLHPTSNDLSVSAEGTILTVSPGRAVCGEGLLNVEEPIRVRLNGKSIPNTSSYLYVNLYHVEKETSPYEMYPYGTATGNLLVEDGHQIKIEASAVGLQDGVPLARLQPITILQQAVTTQEILPGQVSISIEDLRGTYAARLRHDSVLNIERVDPELIGEVEKLFERSGVVDEIFDLLDNKLLQGEEVVTRPLPASQPLFTRTTVEPAYRKSLRVWSSSGSQFLPKTMAKWRVRSSWNLYGLTVTKLANAGDGTARFDVSTDRNLQSVTYDESPVYLRYGGVEYELAEAQTESIVRAAVAPAAGSPASDTNAALHNGATDFYFQASRLTQELDMVFPPGQDEQSYTFDDLDGTPSQGELLLSPGYYQLAIQSIGDSRRGTFSFSEYLSNFPTPIAGHSVALNGELRTPGTTALIGDSDVPVFEEANPFAKLAVGANGELAIDSSELDRYVDLFEDELRRIQEMEVALSAVITPPERVRSEISSRTALVVGYRVLVELQTEKGWQVKDSRYVERDINDIVKELAWLDVNSFHYRGTVATNAALQGHVPSDGPLVSDDVIFSSEAGVGGVFRYEPGLTASEISGLTTVPAASDGSDGKGYWVLSADDLDAFQPATVEAEFTRLQGGADYRATVTPISEAGVAGSPIVVESESLREAYNARLGFNFHQTLTDMYQAARLLLEQVDPDRIDEFIAERMNEIREIIERAALYGNPPRVSGPYQISATPGATTFVGTNLGSVNSVNMRYTPVGSTSEVFVPVNFRVVHAPDAAPSITVTDLPSLADLDPSSAPLLYLEFNAGVQGRDYVAVQYAISTPRIFGPNVGEFKGSRNVGLNTHTGDNTASYYQAILQNNDVKIEGPYPKLWQGTPTDVHETFDTEITVNGKSEAGWLENSNLRVFRFSVKNFEYDTILDARIKRYPSDIRVQGVWYGPSQYIDFTLESLEQESIPYYQQLVVSPEEILLVVHKDLLPKWQGRNFALEYAYYSAPVDPGADDCKGLILENQGASDGVPAGTPQDGWYYYDSGLDQYRVYRSGSWTQATPVGFAQHVFAVGAFRPDPHRQSQANFVLQAGAPYFGPTKHNQFGYDIAIPYSQIEHVYHITNELDTKDIDYVIVDQDGNDSSTFTIDMQDRFSDLYYYDSVKSIRVTAPFSITGARRKDDLTYVNLELKRWLVIVNKQVKTTIVATDDGGTATYDFPIRSHMKAGAFNSTVELVPQYEEV